MSLSKQNVAESVRTRLLNLAKAQHVDFQQVLVRFALERILYRLAKSEHAERFFSRAHCFSLSGMTCRIELYAMQTCSAADNLGAGVEALCLKQNCR